MNWPRRSWPDEAGRVPLWLSGLLDVQADAVEAAYAELGKARRVQSGDWVALVWGE